MFTTFIPEKKRSLDQQSVNGRVVRQRICSEGTNQANGEVKKIQRRVYTVEISPGETDVIFLSLVMSEGKGKGDIINKWWTV